MKKNPNIPPHDSSYIKAYEDVQLLKHDILRPVRMELEVLKPELYMKYFKIDETIVCFGSARVREEKEAKKRLAEAKANFALNPNNKDLQNRVKEAQGLLRLSKYYEEARKFSQIVIKKAGKRFAIVTGGGPGLMEAANRGAYETKGRSIGFNITLPHEQHPNPYLSPNMAFLFHYFAVRKLHLVMRSKAVVVFPGGFGTFDEMFEILTLVKTGKKQDLPIILVGREFWNSVFNLEALTSYGVISQEEAEACTFVETAEEAWEKIAKFYHLKK